MNTIIQRYIFRELLPPFGISLAFFSFIFIITQMNLITDYLVSYQIGVATVGLLLAYAMPYFLQFVIPMSVMLSALLTFLRMSGDMEIVALKAGGVSIYHLLPPVLLFGLGGTFLTAGMTIYASPMCYRASRQLLYEMAAANVDAGLKPRQFIDTYKDVVLYIHDIDSETKTLRNILIEDHRSAKVSSTVVAPRGRLFFDREQLTIQMRLFDGTIHQVDLEDRRANTVAFESYDIRLDVKRNLEALGERGEHVKEMGLGQLYRTIHAAKGKKANYNALKEWHKKFSLPVACLVMALLGMPLGIRARSAKRAYGIGLGLGFFLLYYIMLSLGWMLAESGLYPPVVGMWAPNAVCGAVGASLLAHAVHEKPVVLPPLSKWVRRWRLHQHPRV
ncbi:MAG: LPS export ABC transporter permease LptF [Desulfatitalea sp.]